MFEDFFTRSPAAADPAKEKSVDLEFIPVATAKTLLSSESSQIMLNKLRALLTLPEEVPSYDKLCSQALHNFADFVQHLPGSGAGFTTRPNGLLEHALERTYLATSKCRKFLRPDDNTNKALTPLHALWLYVIFTAALYFQIGYSILKLKVTIHHVKDGSETLWNPYEGNIGAFGSHYKYEIEESNRYLQSRIVTVLLAEHLMPREGFLWITHDKDIFDVWLTLLNEEWDQVGSLCSFIPEADAEIIRKRFNLNEFTSDIELLQDLAPLELDDKKKESTNTRFLDSSLLSKTSAPLDGQGKPLAASAFLKWVDANTKHGKISINQEKSPIHMTKEGVLIAHEVLIKSFLDSNKKIAQANKWDQKNLTQAITELPAVTKDSNNHPITLYKVGDLGRQMTTKAIMINNPHMVFLDGLPPYSRVPFAAAIHNAKMAARGPLVAAAASDSKNSTASNNPPQSQSTPPPNSFKGR